MARIDKVDSVGGTVRGTLAAARTGSATPIAVGLDVNGRVVAGAGVSGIVGVLCDPNDRAARDRVDILKFAELTEFAGVAATVYTANTTTGVITSAAASVSQIRVGHTIELDRLIVGVL